MKDISDRNIKRLLKAISQFHSHIEANNLFDELQAIQELLCDVSYRRNEAVTDLQEGILKEFDRGDDDWTRKYVFDQLHMGVKWP